MQTEYFIRDSDNLIKLTLTEDGVPVSGAWSALDITVEGVPYIHRTADGNGVTLNTGSGLLTISPGDLTTSEKAAFALLTTGRPYRVEIVVTTALNDDGAVFGAPGSEELRFLFYDNPL